MSVEGPLDSALVLVELAADVAVLGDQTRRRRRAIATAVSMVALVVVSLLVVRSRRDPPIYLLPPGGVALHAPWESDDPGGVAAAPTATVQTAWTAVYETSDPGSYSRIELGLVRDLDSASLPSLEVARTDPFREVSPISHVVDFYDPSCGEGYVHGWVLGDQERLRNMLASLRCGATGPVGDYLGLRLHHGGQLRPLWSMSVDIPSDAEFPLWHAQVVARAEPNRDGDWWRVEANRVPGIRREVYVAYADSPLAPWSAYYWREGDVVYLLSTIQSTGSGDGNVDRFIDSLRSVTRDTWRAAVGRAS